MFVFAHIFREITVNRFICSDMLELWLIPQLLEDKPDISKTWQRATTHPEKGDNNLHRQLPGGGYFLAPDIQVWSPLTFSCGISWKIKFVFHQCL